MPEIKLTLVGRTFPVKVSDETQAKRIQDAEKMLNDRILALKQKYPQVDEMIVLLMGCLDLATDVCHADDKISALNEQLALKNKELDDLYFEIDKILQNQSTD